MADITYVFDPAVDTREQVIILNGTETGVATLQAAFGGGLTVKDTVPDGVGLESFQVTDMTTDIVLSGAPVPEDTGYVFPVDSVRIVNTATSEVLYERYYYYTTGDAPQLVSVDAGTVSIYPNDVGTVSFATPSDTAFSLIVPDVTGLDWAILYSPNIYLDLLSTTQIANPSGSRSINYVTNEVEEGEPLPPAVCTFDPTGLSATRNFTVTAASEGIDVGTAGSPLCNFQSTGFTVIVAGTPPAFGLPLTPIIVPVGSTIDPAPFSQLVFEELGAGFGLVYFTAAGTPFILSSFDPVFDFGFPQWTGGTITLADGDLIGLVLEYGVADGGCTIGGTVGATLDIPVTFPYTGAEGFCTNTPDGDGGDGGEPPVPTRPRSATLSTNHVRFYMSYKLIPAGSNTLPPQESVVTPPE